MSFGLWGSVRLCNLGKKKWFLKAMGHYTSNFCFNQFTTSTLHICQISNSVSLTIKTIGQTNWLVPWDTHEHKNYLKPVGRREKPAFSLERERDLGERERGSLLIQPHHPSILPLISPFLISKELNFFVPLQFVGSIFYTKSLFKGFKVTWSLY